MEIRGHVANAFRPARWRPRPRSSTAPLPPKATPARPGYGKRRARLGPGSVDRRPRVLPHFPCHGENSGSGDGATLFHSL